MVCLNHKTVWRVVINMAKNGPKGGGREGAVDRRSQFFNPNTDLWQKRDVDTGRWMDVKTSGGTFKGVRKEK